MNKAREARSFGWLFLGVLILNVLASFLVRLVTTMGVNINDGFLLVLGELLIVLPGVLFVLLRHSDVKCDLGFNKIKVGTVFMSILLAYLIMPLTVLVNLISQLFTTNAAVMMSDTFSSQAPMFITFIVGVFGPFCEEFVFRGIMFTGMKKVTRPLLAGLVSALFFGLMHLNLNQLCYAFVLGFIFALVNEASGSIFTGFIMHLVVNVHNMVLLFISNAVTKGTGVSLTESAQQLVSTDALYYMIAVYLLLAVLCTAIAVPVIAWIAKHEGRTDQLIDMIRGRKSIETESEDDSSSREGKILLNAPALLAVAFAVFMIIGKGWLMDIMGLGDTAAQDASVVSQESDTPADPYALEYIDVAPLSVKGSQIFVEAIPSLPDDFLYGVDISTLLVQENSGVVYYSEDGSEADIMKTLRENGVNSVRIRVWNDPYDENGNGYGGGNNDVDTAIAIGRRASAYGMSVLIDFHCSDFWADPSKQMEPKAWRDMGVTDKEKELYDYVYTSLQKMIEQHVNVTMVQIGNETTTGICGETSWPFMAKLYRAGANAVRDVAAATGQDMKVAVHFTNPETQDNYRDFAKKLAEFNVDYDVFASSWYPYWHGTAEKLSEILAEIANTYDKDVCVVEVSYAYTYDDGDNFGNTIAEDTSASFPYAISPQGQADCIRDAANAVAACGKHGLGVYYWEPAWIPVPGNSFEERSVLWEKYGSGWASKASGSYDPEDAGKFYGGSSWDNQALFDFEGKPLPSLSVFRYLKNGATTEVIPTKVADTVITVRKGEEIDFPKQVFVEYNDGSEKLKDVVWDQNAADYDNTVIKQYELSGSVDADGTTLSAKAVLDVKDLNFVENYSFEDDDLSMWNIVNVDNATDEVFVIDKEVDAVSGTKSMHFYSKGPVEMDVSQTITDLAPGTYYFTLALHGDGNNQELYIYAEADGKEYTCDTDMGGWTKYRYPRIDGIEVTDGTVTIGAHVKAGSGAWGNLDDFVLAPMDE